MSTIPSTTSVHVVDRAELETLFVSMLRARWQRGAEQYGDTSFTRPLPETAEQIIEEAVDIGGWSLVLFEQVRQRLARVVDCTATVADLHARAVAAEAERDAMRARLASIAQALDGATTARTWADVVDLLALVARVAKEVRK